MNSMEICQSMILGNKQNMKQTNKPNSKSILIIFSQSKTTHHRKAKQNNIPTKFYISMYSARYKKSYCSDKRIVDCLNKIRQCCTTVNSSSSIGIFCWCKCIWVNWEGKSIDSNTLKLQVVMLPEILLKRPVNYTAKYLI